MQNGANRPPIPDGYHEAKAALALGAHMNQPSTVRRRREANAASRLAQLSHKVTYRFTTRGAGAADYAQVASELRQLGAEMHSLAGADGVEGGERDGDLAADEHDVLLHRRHVRAVR